MQAYAPAVIITTKIGANPENLPEKKRTVGEERAAGDGLFRQQANDEGGALMVELRRARDQGERWRCYWLVAVPVRQRNSLQQSPEKGTRLLELSGERRTAGMGSLACSSRREGKVASRQRWWDETAAARRR